MLCFFDALLLIASTRGYVHDVHAGDVQASEPDSRYLLGLDNVVRFFQALIDKHEARP